MKEKNSAPAASLYLHVADTLAGLIVKGTYRTGERIPSIRELSTQFNVSINTVRAAYGVLEDRCLIEAKPQSGYYVRPRLPALPGEPSPIQDKPAGKEISSTDLVIRIMQDILDPDLVQFGAAIPAPELIPAAKLNRILGSITKRRVRASVDYAIPPGNPYLRNRIAKRMVKAGCPLNPQEIVITTGASEAVYLALRTLCCPGDTIAVGTPVYFSFIEMFKAMQLKVIEIPSSPVDGLHLESLRIVLENTSISACLVISNFNNPLGICLPDNKKEELVRLLADHEVPLIEDDINGDLSFSGTRPTVAKAWDKSDNVLLCSSFSKTLAPGYRVGWIAPGRYLEKVVRQKLITNIACPGPTQLAVAEFLDNGGYDRHLRKIRCAYATKAALMTEAISTYFPQETRVTRPTGGYALWLEMPRRINSIDLYFKARDLGITVAPGTVFSTSGKFSNCLRLNCAFWSEENRPAIEKLGKAADALARKDKQ